MYFVYTCSATYSILRESLITSHCMVGKSNCTRMLLGYPDETMLCDRISQKKPKINLVTSCGQLLCMVCTCQETIHKRSMNNTVISVFILLSYVASSRSNHATNTVMTGSSTAHVYCGIIEIILSSRSSNTHRTTVTD